MGIYDNMLNAIKEEGFEVIAHERDSKKCFIKKIFSEKVPSTSKLKTILQNMDSSVRIRFFDDDPDTYDEEGGYCQAIILNETTALFCESNHEWSKEWEQISIDDLAMFMQYNWSQDDIWGKYKNYFIVEQNKYGSLVTFCNIGIKQPA